MLEHLILALEHFDRKHGKPEVLNENRAPEDALFAHGVDTQASRDRIRCVGRRRGDYSPGVRIGSRAVIGAFTNLLIRPVRT
jgi:hypothetical protein